MAKIVETCWHCKDRHSGCHSECEKYIKAKADYEKSKAEYMKAKDLEYDYESYRKRKIDKIVRSHH